VLDDAAALVSKMNSFGREFVIDYNHADSFARRNGGEAPAAGWMKKFSVGEDGGIYADVEWTDKARGEIERKEYKYISPTLFHDERTKVITGFSGAALVNFRRSLWKLFVLLLVLQILMKDIPNTMQMALIHRKYH
ncbi:phage protease, partial [Escherichia coli]|uniref:phage protease n=1 Tax=Escherichia coli TaxID=562 RepID=UPI001429AFC7